MKKTHRGFLSDRDSFPDALCVDACMAACMMPLLGPAPKVPSTFSLSHTLFLYLFLSTSLFRDRFTLPWDLLKIRCKLKGLFFSLSLSHAYALAISFPFSFMTTRFDAIPPRGRWDNIENGEFGRKMHHRKK